MSRFKFHEVDQLFYFRVPKPLVLVEYYREILGSDACILYGIMLETLEASRKNNWVNDDGDLYIKLTRKKAAEMLNVSLPTATKAFKQLAEAELIEEIQQGLNKPNIIFVHKITRSEKYLRSGHKNFLFPEEKEFDPNTDLEFNTDQSNTIVSSLKLLLLADVAPQIAARLANDFPYERIKQVVNYARLYSNRDSIAGLVYSALTEPYNLEKRTKDDRKSPVKLYKDPLEDLTPEEKEKIREEGAHYIKLAMEELKKHKKGEAAT